MLNYGEDYLQENEEALRLLSIGMAPAAIELASKTAPIHTTPEVLEEEEYEAA